MAYLGLQPDTSFRKLSKQTITGNGGATYTLDYPVNNASELEVYVNNVRQEPEVAYTVLNQTLTMTDNVLATDSFYVVYQGQAIGTLRIPEKDNSDNYNFDNSLLYLDAANNRVGIGITPSTKLHVYGEDTELRVQSSSNTNGFLRFINTSGSMSIGMSGAALNALLTYDRTNNHTVHQYLGGASGYHAWNTNGTERMRIDSSGRVLIGTTSPASGYVLQPYGKISAGDETDVTPNAFWSGQLTIKGNGYAGGLSLDATGMWVGHNSSGRALLFATDETERMRIDSAGNVGIGTTSPVAPLDFAGNRMAFGKDGSNFFWLRSRDISTEPNNLAMGIAANTTHITDVVFRTGGSERFRVDNFGNILFNTTDTTLFNNTSGTGICYRVGASFDILSASDNALIVNRTGTDGGVIEIRQDGVVEGTISVSGTTVTYGAFSGSHWSQLSDNSRPDILKGTVVETIDEKCEWPDQENDQLVKFKVSDTSASKRVYGVFMSWDNDDLDNNDAYITSLGAYLIRIAAGHTVEGGDLLESNGDGCARVQADDIIRSSTIGKVTSNIPTHTYEDGSYTVPCVLYCG